MMRIHSNFINELMFEKSLISEIIERMERGEVLESVLWDILNRSGFKKVVLVSDREHIANFFIKKLLKIDEFKLIIKLLTKYDLNNFSNHLRAIKELMKLLERNAFNKHLDETVKKRFIMKTVLIASTLSISTGVVLASIPKILVKISNKYMKFTMELISLYSLSTAVVFALNTYIILEIISKRKNISKTVPIIIFVTTLLIFILVS
ncbi:MAG: hypothetical protein ACP6IP_07680 [Candidatus Njordarchaeia archaeon]